MTTPSLESRVLRLSLALLLVLCGIVQAQTGAGSANPDLLADIDATIRQDIAELTEIARGQDPDQDDVHRKIYPESGSWEGNQATSNNNPLVTQECHEGAMKDAIESMKTKKHLDHDGAVEMIKGHLQERQAFEKTGITYAEYISHVAECKALCNVVVTELIGCHVRAVSGLDHEIVVFDLNSTTVKDYSSRAAIERVSSTLKSDPDRRVLLIGRASRIGHLGYNRKLSRQRASAVGQELSDQGIDMGRMKMLAFGYEPPQIDSPIAQAYKLYDVYQNEGEQKTNQSVMMVLY